MTIANTMLSAPAYQADQAQLAAVVMPKAVTATSEELTAIYDLGGGSGNAISVPVMVAISVSTPSCSA